jgi:hypothetical protein
VAIDVSSLQKRVAAPRWERERDGTCKQVWVWCVRADRRKERESRKSQAGVGVVCGVASFMKIFMLPWTSTHVKDH